MNTAASGVGVATIAADGTVLDVWFPAPELAGDGPSGTVRLSVAEIPGELAELVGRDDDRDVDVVAVRTVIASLDDKPADTYDAYLRLHLLPIGWSSRMAPASTGSSASWRTWCGPITGRAPWGASSRCGPGCAGAVR